MTLVNRLEESADGANAHLIYRIICHSGQIFLRNSEICNNCAFENVLHHLKISYWPRITPTLLHAEGLVQTEMASISKGGYLPLAFENLGSFVIRVLCKAQD